MGDGCPLDNGETFYNAYVTINTFLCSIFSHGTWCAGISSAAMNDFCVLGIAYMSTFGGIVATEVRFY